MAGLRHKLYCQLFTEARDDDQLSLTNKVIAVIIVLAVLLAILATEPELMQRWRWLVFAFEIVIGVVFLVEYIARIWCVVEGPGEGGNLKRRLKFIVSPFALIDLIVVVASLVPFLFGNAAILRILRLIRLAALMKFGRFSRALREIAKAIAERGYDLLVTLALAASLLLFGATAMYYVEGDIQPDAFGSIPRAMWWSIITLTTVGYGDVSPITPAGKALASLVALSGIGLVAMPTGIIAAAFSDAMQRHREAREAGEEDKEFP
jgi:voltage-gated potassium channel